MLNLIPISDVNPTRRVPVVTLGLIILNIASFLREPLTGAPGRLNLYFIDNAPVPCQLVNTCNDLIQGPHPIPQRGFLSFLGAVVFSTFLHANLLHIAGNMLFLWVFGNNVEDHLGRVKFVVFYLAGGIFASYAHVAWSLATAPEACTAADLGPCVPAVGASGAVAAVMGAYLLLFPHARVNVLVPIFVFFTVVEMSALAVLGLWFLYQFLIAYQDLAGPSGVAWMAHVGGFVFGAIAIFLLGGRPKRRRPAWEPQWGRY